MTLQSFIEAIPKVELHVHLAGSIRPKTLVVLSERYGRPLPEPELQTEGRWPPFRDITHFIAGITQASGMVRSADDIELIARDFMEGQAAQNVVYTEITFTAYGNYFVRGIPMGDQLAALGRTRAWAEEELGVTFRIILDIIRERSAEETDFMVDWAIEGMECGVVAVGLTGDERNPLEDSVVTAFARAKAAGMASIPHAGEIAGPDSIWSAVRELDPDRIAHGVRCIEDPALVAELRERRIPLDVCPTSNVCLGVCSDLDSHPMRAMVEAGLLVTIGSDDPPMFNTSLTDEYMVLAGAYGFGPDELEQLTLNGVRATLLAQAERADMESRFRAQFASLRKLHGV